jgi:FtsP/CotA-like multicopper oxidase with cupredoxin domain
MTSEFTRWRRILHSRRFLAIIVVVVAVAGFAATAYSLHLFGQGGDSCAAHFTSAPGSAHFTVIMSANGYNDSKIYGLPRPVMNVTLGDRVTIHLVNIDTTESHGFSISVYFPNGGPILGPGKCYDLTFTANQAGTFLVYCQIFCLPHIPWMQHGELNVNP